MLYAIHRSCFCFGFSSLLLCFLISVKFYYYYYKIYILQSTRHAEMEAIDALLEQLQKNGLSMTEIAKRFSNYNLYVTCEPCIMCASALSNLGMLFQIFNCSISISIYFYVVLSNSIICQV
jgi:hypothetical protein